MDHELHKDSDAARGGSTPNIVRYVLGISVVLAIVLLSVVWMTGAATSEGGAADEINATAKIQANERDSSTDGIVSDDADRMEGAAPAPSDTGALDTVRN